MNDHATATASTQDRPWTPSQILGVAVLFGPGAAGAIAGVNFARLGKRDYALPCIIAGFGLFLVVAMTMAFVIPDSASGALGLLVNTLLGFMFMQIQKPYFDIWQAAHLAPAGPGQRYKAGHLGQLLVISLLCFLIEIALLLSLTLIP